MAASGLLRIALGAIATPLAAFAVAAGAAGADAVPPCRPAYIVPYGEQCDFGHASIHKDHSAKNVSAAFDACDRAQNVAGACLSSTVRQVHVVALSALYHAVSEQADIALFAGQYRTGEALLREELNVIAIAAREAKPGDPAIARERAQATADLAATQSGECTMQAYASSAPARSFARAKRYRELEKTLVGESAQYARCAALATTAAKRAYVQYVSYVAIEEAGRAAQAADDPSDASKLFGVCIAGVAKASAAADATTKRYLAVLGKLCAGRKDGTYTVDQPEPIDRQAGAAFTPLALPTN